MQPSEHPEAAFLAVMTASATHEVRNVLAIIKESAGLIEDMVRLAAKRGVLDQEKVFRAVDRIDTQVKRGADLLTNLNHLSHSLDHETAAVDMQKEVEQIVFLSQRFARQRGHRVALGSVEPAGETVTRPLALQMVLFGVVEYCLEELPGGASVTVGMTAENGVPAVNFSGRVEDGGPVQAPRDTDAWSHLGHLTDALGATLERDTTGFEIRILFPPSTGGRGVP
jgi:signal transduction histidine kinase